jgi:Concanavalin A-like lectin/glucanases superfamily
MKKIKKLKNKCSGFVILFAMVFSAILLAVGLGVADIALKEIGFSTSAKSSNDSFLAADTGVECALFNDTEDIKAFSYDEESVNNDTSVECLGGFIDADFDPTEVLPTWRFVVPAPAGQNYCSIVAVIKNETQYYTKTDIISKGYNIGDSNCGSTNPNRIERELKVTYSTIPVPEPVAYWKFNETSGTTAADSSFAGGNNGTLSGWAVGVNPWVAGQINNAINFTGAGEIVSPGSPSTLDDLGPLTFSALIKPTNIGQGGNGTIISKTNGVGDMRFNLGGNNAVIFRKDFSGNDLSTKTNDNFITLGGWNHVVVTWDGSTSASGVHIYKVVGGDAIEAASYQSPTNATGAKDSDAALNFNIGNVAQLWHAFNGVIDEVKIFNKVLSKEEIETFLP